MRNRILGIGLLALVVLFLPASATVTGNVIVEITELRSSEGQVLVSIYNDAKGYPRNRDAVLQTKIVDPIESTDVRVVFENLPHGEYALAIMHDENKSGDMDYAAFGLPAEGYCFSNNLRPRLRAPKFKKAKFVLDNDNVTQRLRMRY